MKNSPSKNFKFICKSSEKQSIFKFEQINEEIKINQFKPNYAQYKFNRLNQELDNNSNECLEKIEYLIEQINEVNNEQKDEKINKIKQNLENVHIMVLQIALNNILNINLYQNKKYSFESKANSEIEQLKQSNSKFMEIIDQNSNINKNRFDVDIQNNQSLSYSTNGSPEIKLKNIFSKKIYDNNEQFIKQEQLKKNMQNNNYQNQLTKRYEELLIKHNNIIKLIKSYGIEQNKKVNQLLEDQENIPKILINWNDIKFSLNNEQSLFENINNKFQLQNIEFILKLDDEQIICDQYESNGSISYVSHNIILKCEYTQSIYSINRQIDLVLNEIIPSEPNVPYKPYMKYNQFIADNNYQNVITQSAEVELPQQQFIKSNFIFKGNYVKLKKLSREKYQSNIANIKLNQEVQIESTYQQNKNKTIHELFTEFHIANFYKLQKNTLITDFSFKGLKEFVQNNYQNELYNIDQLQIYQFNARSGGDPNIAQQSSPSQMKKSQKSINNQSSIVSTESKATKLYSKSSDECLNIDLFKRKIIKHILRKLQQILNRSIKNNNVYDQDILFDCLYILCSRLNYKQTLLSDEFLNEINLLNLCAKKHQFRTKLDLQQFDQFSERFKKLNNIQLKLLNNYSEIDMQSIKQIKNECDYLIDNFDE